MPAFFPVKHKIAVFLAFLGCNTAKVNFLCRIDRISFRKELTEGTNIKMPWLKTQFSLKTNRGILSVAFLILAAHISLAWFAISRSYFYEDDFQFLTDAALGNTGVEWVFDRHNVHLMPVGKSLSLLVGLSPEPFNWQLATVQMVVLVLLAAIAFFWALQQTYGLRPGTLVQFAFYLTSPLIWVAYFWWLPSLNLLSGIIGFSLTWAFAIRYFRNKRFVDLLGLALFHALVLGSVSSGIMVSPVIGFVAWAYFTEGKIWKRFLNAVRKYWIAWLIIAAESSVKLYFFFTVDQKEVPVVSAKTVLQTIDYLTNLTAVSSLLGGPLRWSSFSVGNVSPPNFWVVLVAAALGIVIFARWLNHRLALVPPLIVLFHVATVAVLVGWGRADAWGASISGTQPRYLVLSAVLTFLIMGAMFYPIKGSVSGPSLRARPRLNFKPSRRTVAMTLGLSLIGSIFSTTAFATQWIDRSESNIESWVVASVSEIKRKNPTLASGIVPNKVLWGAFFPYTKYSMFFAPLGSDLDVVSSGNNLSTLSDEGTVHPAWIPNPPTHFPGATPGCGYLVNEEPVTIEFEPTGFLGSWISIGYLSGAPGFVAVNTDNSWRRVEILEGLNTAFIWVADPTDYITITPNPGVGLCVDQVRTGELEPLIGPAQ